MLQYQGSERSNHKSQSCILPKSTQTCNPHAFEAQSTDKNNRNGSSVGRSRLWFSWHQYKCKRNCDGPINSAETCNPQIITNTTASMSAGPIAAIVISVVVVVIVLCIIYYIWDQTSNKNLATRNHDHLLSSLYNTPTHELHRSFESQYIETLAPYCTKVENGDKYMYCPKIPYERYKRMKWETDASGIERMVTVCEDLRT